MICFLCDLETVEKSRKISEVLKTELIIPGLKLTPVINISTPSPIKRGSCNVYICTGTSDCIKSIPALKAT